MKRILVLALGLVLCLVLFAGCGDEPTIDEQLRVGMYSQEVYELVGSHGTPSELSAHILIYDTGDEEKLYVFIEQIPNSDAIVTHFERRKDMEIKVGMTLDEINALLRVDGARCHNAANIYTWDFSLRPTSLYAWLDSDGVLVKYVISSKPSLVRGMSYEEVTDFFLSEGEAVSYIPGLYRWPTQYNDKYCYARFKNGGLVEWFEQGPTIFTGSTTYERIAELYGTDGTLFNKDSDTYYWSTPDGKTGLFKFNESNGKLELSRFALINGRAEIGMTLTQINECIGTVGVAVPNISGLYCWALNDPNEYIYAAVNNEKVSNIFIDGEIKISTGMTYERLIYLYGTSGVPVGKGAIYSWPTSDDTIGIFKFKNYSSVLRLEEFVLDAKDLTGMTLTEINGLLGSTGVSVEDESATVYKWGSVFDEGIYVWFDNDMVATKFSYTSAVATTLELGIRRDEVNALLGEPRENTNGKLWNYQGGEVYIIFVNDIVVEFYEIKHLDIYVGMTIKKAINNLGKNPYMISTTPNIYHGMEFHTYYFEIQVKSHASDEKNDGADENEKRYYLQFYAVALGDMDPIIIDLVISSEQYP